MFHSVMYLYESIIDILLLGSTLPFRLMSLQITGQ